MQLSNFFETRLGVIYALDQNGLHCDGEYSHRPARAKLAVLRSYLQSLDTDVLGVALIGDAVALPMSVLKTRKKWWVFGSIIEKTVIESVEEVYDFDFVIFTKEPRAPMNVKAWMYEGGIVGYSGLRMKCLTPEAYKTALDNGDFACISVRDGGVFIMNAPDFELNNLGHPLLEPTWWIDSNGNWNCQINKKK